MAQDESGVQLWALPIDVERTAALCGLPPGAFTGWKAATASRVMDPMFGQDGEPLTPTDPAWLDRFTTAGLEAKFYFGPVHEAPGSGEAAMAAIAAALQ